MIRNKNIQKQEILCLFLVSVVLLSYIPVVFSAPSGPLVSYDSTETVTPRSAAIINTTGGSFTKMILNGTSQTYKWKAYVGNVTGIIQLADAANYSIYDWDIASIEGEVYASRKSTTVSWADINCSNSTQHPSCWVPKLCYNDLTATG